MPDNSSNSEWTYAEAIASLLMNEEVEIYTGESVGTVNYSDNDVEEKALVRGIIRGCKGQVLMLEVTIATAMQTRTTMAYLNGWYIKGVNRVSDGIPIARVFDNTQRVRGKR